MCGQSLPEKQAIKPVWSTAMGTVQEAIILSLLTDSEVTASQKRKTLEATFAKIDKMSAKHKVDIQQHMNAVIIATAGGIIAAQM